MKKGKEETLDLFGTETFKNTLRRETMDAARMDGCSCPVCDQFVKVYKRTVTSTMARQLIHAWRCHGQAWFHTRDVVMQASGAGDFSKLEHWGLIVAQPHKTGEEGKKSSGMWRVTDKGVAFIEGKATVQQYAAIYNNTFLEFLGNEVTVRDALGTAFDYRVLMGWVLPQTAPQGSQNQNAGVSS